MRGILTFIVIIAILGNTATSTKWRNHHSHSPDCDHHHNEWNLYPGGLSTSNEEYGWPQYNEYKPNTHQSSGWEDHHQHQAYPNYDWSDNNDSNWAIGQRSTSSSPTPFPTDRTVNPNSQTPFIQPSDTTVFSSPASMDANPPFSPTPSPQTSESSSTDVQACLRSCPVTTEYEPICGTDYQTYTNMGRFLCAQGCGVDVRIFLRRRCPSLGVGATRTTRVQCIASCPITDENNPVCGSDDITYENPSQLLCAQMCGYNVMVKSMSSCSEATTTQEPNLFRTPPIPFGIRSCIQSCSTTSEFMPVCGSNDVTYKNPSHLDCARICGVDVEIKQRLPCGQTNNNANNPTIPSVDDQRVNKLPPGIQMCVNSCPVTADVKPVCGTNGITYKNPSQLECDRLCGIRVDILQQAPCPPNTNNQVTSTKPTLTATTLSPEIEACIRACPQTPEYNPVCGTNSVTYNNLGHLSCAQSCGVSVDVKRRSTCPRPAVADSSPSNPATTIPNTVDINRGSDTVNGNNNVDVNVITNPPAADKGVTTISPGLLLSIFPDATTIKTTTTTESDEDTDFDSRFGEDGV